MYKHESEKEYHAKSMSGEYMSSHLLFDFMESPLVYAMKITGLWEQTTSTDFAFGTAAHKYILEGADVFNTEYVVSEGPINPKTGEPYGKATKAYQEWEQAQCGKIIRPEDYATIVTMNSSVQHNATAKGLLATGDSECVVRAELYDVPCQIRIDWLTSGAMMDLKTTADINRFEYDAKRFKYLLQSCFYKMVYEKAFGEKIDAYICAVEKVQPFTCGVWLVTDAVIERGEKIIAAALTRYKKCKELNRFPTNYENMRYFTEL
jgi:exodeoxyribonuclease VIII